jgi:hypothetical protein
VVRYLGGDEGAIDRTAELAATAPRAEAWSSEEELNALLLRQAVRSDGPAQAEDGAWAVSRRALALVELARRTPDDAAGDLGISKAELLDELARAAGGACGRAGSSPTASTRPSATSSRGCSRRT